VPAGAPWPVVVLLGVLGLALAVVREFHRHAESTSREENRHAEILLTLATDRPALDIPAVVPALRGPGEPTSARPDRAR
jgi:hypothetical protein